MAAKGRAKSRSDGGAPVASGVVEMVLEDIFGEGLMEAILDHLISRHGLFLSPDEDTTIKLEQLNTALETVFGPAAAQIITNKIEKFRS